DSLSNAYLAYALLIYAALEGIQNKEQLPDPVTQGWDDIPLLPESLSDAIAAAKDSEFIKRTLPQGVLDAFLQNAEEMLLLDRQDKTGLFNMQFERF
ncbi:MAG TPA: hypothetical protein PK537_09730, partial [Candidatus Limiplasma sp.]|nr:hypothetical protein [Candidatus Limiplasma sp.]